MRRIWAVWKKELRSYFVSPIAYVVCTGFLVITGYLFYNNIIYYSILSLQAQSTPYLFESLNVTEMVIYPIFINASIVLIFLVPLLTMRLFSEEKKTGTIEILLTYPIRDVEALLGKFGACLCIYLVILALNLSYPLIVAIFGKPEIGPLISGYIGLILLGVAFISLGIFASSLTENQIVAAVITFGSILLFWGLGWSKDLVAPPLGDILAHLSLLDHLRSFAKGVIEVKGVVYYLSFSFFFLFLTLRSLESKRWRG
ncbi:MAG: ABC transporter permease [Deltaproteobacteria bacterium]|nr:MAG: ABC transporter permease [Deltaproteobacteria bacterium]